MLYLDEDFSDAARIHALRGRGLDVLSAGEAGMLRRSDHEHLRLAYTLGRVILTHNTADFVRIHREFIERGEHHAGICIMIKKLNYGPGEIARRVLAMQAKFETAGTQDQLLYLSNFS